MAGRYETFSGPLVGVCGLGPGLLNKFIQIKRRPLLENQKPKLIMRPAAVYQGTPAGGVPGTQWSHVRHTRHPHNNFRFTFLPRPRITYVHANFGVAPLLWWKDGKILFISWSFSAMGLRTIFDVSDAVWN